MTDDGPVRPRVRVAAVIVDADRILLARHEKDGRSYWLLPGGGVEFGESLEDALKRELMEEANLAIEAGNLLFVNDMIPPDKSRHVVHLFFAARVTGGELRCAPDHRLREVRYVPVAAIGEMTLFPGVQDALRKVLETDSEPGAPYLGALWQA